MAEVVGVGVGVVAGISVLALLFKLFFGDVNGFWECIRFWFTPDIISLFRGEWHEDYWSELKLGCWIVAGVMSGLAAYTAVSRLLS